MTPLEEADQMFVDAQEDLAQAHRLMAFAYDKLGQSARLRSAALMELARKQQELLAEAEKPLPLPPKLPSTGS